MNRWITLGALLILGAVGGYGQIRTLNATDYLKNSRVDINYNFEYLDTNAAKKGAGFAVSKVAFINSSGLIDAVSSNQTTYCVRVDGSAIACAPLAHVHILADVTGLDTILANKAALIHTHAEGDLSFTDITTANASASRHGLLPKLSNSTADVLRGDGTWATIATIVGYTPANVSHVFLTNNPHAVTASQVGLGSVVNADTTNASNISSGTLAAARQAVMVGDSGAGGVQGAVPAPATGDAAAGKYLKANGTWAVPPDVGGSCAVGPTGALVESSECTLDIDTAVVCTKAGTCDPTGYQNHSSAAGWRPPEKTVSTLPSAASNTGKVFVVTDGTSVTDCTTGSSTIRALCVSNGSAWVTLAGAGSTNPRTVLYHTYNTDVPGDNSASQVWATYTITGGTLQAGDIVEVRAQLRKTAGTDNDRNIGMYFGNGVTPAYGVSVATGNQYTYYTDWLIASSTTAMPMGFKGSPTTVTNVGTQADGAVDASSLDLSGSIVVKMQTTGAAQLDNTNTIKVVAFTVTRYRPS